MSNDPLTDPAVQLRYSPVALGSVALLSLGAGLINLAFVLAQLPASALFAVLFLGVGLVQIVLAGAVVRAPGQRLFVAATVGTTVLVLLWLISGTTGLPFGTPAPIGVPDTVCAALELVSVPILLTLALRGPRRRRRRPARTALLTTPIVLVVAAATYVGLGTAMSTMSAMPAASPSGDPGGLPSPPGPPAQRTASPGSPGSPGSEGEVTPLAAHGRVNAEIAALLVISPATVKTHIARAMTKVGTRDRAQLVVFAYQSGLVRPPGP